MKPKATKESLIRSLIRTEIRRITEQESEGGEETTTPDPKNTNKEEPAKASFDYDGLTKRYVDRLRQAGEEFTTEDLIEAVGNIISAFESSSEGKLKVLKSIKSNIVY